MNPKPYIQTHAVSNLATFLGENLDSTAKSLDAAMDVFLDFVKIKMKNAGNADDLHQILTQGGHTGNIINNFEEICIKPEKIQVLGKIGQNIYEHFSGQKVEIKSEYLASVHSIKKSSASTLLNIAGPLVLGQIGKERIEKHYATEDLYRGLIPQHLDTVFDSKASKPQLVQEVEKKKVTKLKEKTSTPSRKWVSILPWIILGVLCITPFLKNKPKDILGLFNKKTETDRLDSILNANPADFLPNDSEDTTIKLLPKEEIKKENISKTPEETKTKVKPAPTEKVEKKIVPVPVKKPSEVKKPEPKKIETLVTKTEAEKVIPSTKTANIPAGWSALSTGLFKKNSAEIINSSLLDKFLNKSVSIAPASNNRLAEDRAYAVQGYLIEKGNEKCTVMPKMNASTGSLVLIKVN
jgi:hypothetical protein